jgi:flavin-dependent dehydrogenase
MKIGIVGCGIVGSYLAWKLSKEHDVTVFEKNKKIGEKACSGLVSKRIWKFIPRNDEIIENVIEEAHIHFPKKKIILDFYPEMFVVNRKKLDQYVASLAEKSGAKIFLDSEVKKVYYVKKKRPQVLVSGKVIEFDYLIGCDGFFSIVRKTLGIKDPKYVLGIYCYVNKKDDSQKVDVYPLKNGFAWRIPRGKRVEYGLLELPNVARLEFKKFCKRKRVKPGRIYSAPIPYGLVDASRERIALCGDSIGLTKPLSSGGIVWGLIASEIPLENFPNFKRYSDGLDEFFEPKIFFSQIGNKLARFLASNIPWLLPRKISFDSDIIY